MLQPKWLAEWAVETSKRKSKKIYKFIQIFSNLSWMKMEWEGKMLCLLNDKNTKPFHIQSLGQPLRLHIPLWKAGI